MKAWFLLAAALCCVAGLTLLQSFQGAAAAPPAESSAATYAHGVLHASIPYPESHGGTGQLTVEVLDPEDRTLGRSQQRVTLGANKGQWEVDIRLANPPAIDELPWHRLRYRFNFDGKYSAIEGAESISQILRMPVVHILGQQSYLKIG